METHQEVNFLQQGDNENHLSFRGQPSVNFHQRIQHSSLKNANLEYSTVSSESEDLTEPANSLDVEVKHGGAVSFASFENKAAVIQYQNAPKSFGSRIQPYQIVDSSEEATPDSNHYNFGPAKKKKRKKFFYTNDGNLILVKENYSVASSTFTQAKRMEVLKAARALFSKRTRTLYHWMYPTASKQQIKSIVASSWDSLAENEKGFYVSQVLGRFGLTQNNLMVNPQLGAIKEPPPLAERTVTHTKSQELQSALSSISPGTSADMLGTNSMTFEEFEALNERTRKKRGRPKGSTQIKKKIKPPSKDFQDDPELSQELEKFATKFNLNRYY